MSDRTTPATAVLDSEAVSVIAQPSRRSASIKRAQAVLEVIERRGGFAVIPAPVIAEVRRGKRASAIDHLLNRLAVVDTDRDVASEAGDLLHRHRLGSAHAVDALVAATAKEIRPSIILTGDEKDLSRFCNGYHAVTVQALP